MNMPFIEVIDLKEPGIKSFSSYLGFGDVFVMFLRRHLKYVFVFIFVKSVATYFM